MDKNLGLYLQLAKYQESFRIHDAACLLIGISPGSPKADFLERYNDDGEPEINQEGLLEYWHPEPEFRRYFDVPFLSESGPFIDEAKQREELKQLSEINHKYNEVTGQLNWLSNHSESGSVSREAFFALVKARGEFLEALDLTKEGIDEGKADLPTIPSGLDESVVIRLQAMIDAATKYWLGVNQGDNWPTNDQVAAEMEKLIGNRAAISPTLANKMASVVRPDWAKEKKS